MTDNPKSYNQLRAMFAVSRASFRAITRSPSAVVFTLLFPLVFILVFGFISESTIQIRIGTTPGTDTSNTFYKELTGVPGIRLMHDDDAERQLNDLKKGRIDALFSFERITPGEPVIVTMQTSSAAPEKTSMLRLITENISNRLNIDAQVVKNKKYLLETVVYESRKYTMIDFILPGQLGFSILSAGVFGTAFVFFNLRQTLVIKRFFATPIRRPYIILGEALSRLVFSLLGSLFLIIVGYYFFGFTLVNGMVTVLEMMLLSAAGLIIFMGFGFIISGVAKNDSMIPPLANTITLPQFLLSGTFFPITAFPDWLQPFCKVLPLTHLNEALRMVAFDGAPLSSLGIQVGALLLWGVLIYALAVKFFRWE
jgi:ABC-2 type transport system permease protein